MRRQLLASFSTKVAIGVGVAALAAGTAGAMVVMEPVSDHGVDAAAVDETTTTAGVTTTTTTAPTTTTTARKATTTAPGADAKVAAGGDECDGSEHEADDDHRDADEGDDDQATGTETEAEEAAEHEHPDNFGAQVSDDAKDCGVDGQTVSQQAHDRNDDRKAGPADATSGSTRDGGDGSGSRRDAGRSAHDD